MIRFDLNIDESDLISKTVKNRFHNYVNITKEFLKEGYTSYGRTFHATFAVEHGKVKAVGFNDYRREIDYKRGYGRVKHFNDPISEYRMCLHSEFDAILKLGKIDYSAFSFFNVRLDKNGHCRQSKPCPNCIKNMMQVGVRNVYYYDEKSNSFKMIRL